jgi:hypothetical protein
MRKPEQTKILESLQTLAEAHGELRKQVSPSFAINLLAIQSAVSLLTPVSILFVALLFV